MRTFPEFIAELRPREATAARGLEFCILTATRTSEAMEARWQEIDLDAKVWTLPAERTKAGREHRIPLSERAVQILREMEKAKYGEFVFTGRKPDRPLSNMAFEISLRRAKSEFTTHGFRSSFRDWAGNETRFPRELAEAALAHAVGDKPNTPIGDPMRWRGGASLWTHGRAIARAERQTTC